METPAFFYRQLMPEDKSKVVRFINGQINTIPQDFFFPPDLAIIEKSLSSESGISHGTFDQEQLVGIRLTYKPGLDKENHGNDLGYAETELNQIAQFHGTLVVNDRRYKGIGTNLVKINCEEIFKNHFLRILATVHPDNFTSIRMLLNNNFTQRLLTKKYNNLPRLIFEKIKQ